MYFFKLSISLCAEPICLSHIPACTHSHTTHQLTHTNSIKNKEVMAVLSVFSEFELTTEAELLIGNSEAETETETGTEVETTTQGEFKEPLRIIFL